MLLRISVFMLWLSGASTAKATLRTPTEGHHAVRDLVTNQEPVTFSIGNIRPEKIAKLSDEAKFDFNLTVNAANGEPVVDEFDYGFVSQLLWGGMYIVNLSNQDVQTVIPSTAAMGLRPLIGLAYSGGLILAAGGQTGLVNVFSTSGELLVQCAVIQEGNSEVATLLNDVAVVGSNAYITDSASNKIMVLDVAQFVVDSSCGVSSITLSEDIVGSSGEILSNGIVQYKEGFFVAISQAGGLYYHDLVAGTSHMVLAPGSMTTPDGLEIANDDDDGIIKLYATENSANRISVWEVSGNTGADIQAAPLGFLFSKDFDFPATSTVVGGLLFSVNGRFGIGFPADGEGDLDNFMEEFQVVGVDRFDLQSDKRSVVPAAFDLRNVRPEGTHALPVEAVAELGLEWPGPYVLVSQLLYGGVVAVNTVTGDLTPLVPMAPFLTKFAVGVNYYKGQILLAGGATGMFSVYDGMTGGLIADCARSGEAQGPTINDIAVVGDRAYISDSTNPSVMVVDLEATTAGACAVLPSIPLPSADFFIAGQFLSNGIVEYKNGFFIAVLAKGRIWYYDLDDANLYPVTNENEAPGVDGIEIAAGEDGAAVMYATEGFFNRVSVWTIADSMDPVIGIRIDLAGYLLSDDYDSPSTSAVVGNVLFSVNARFGLTAPAVGEQDPLTFHETFHMVGMDRYAVQQLDTPTDPPATIGDSMMSAAPTSQPTDSSGAWTCFQFKSRYVLFSIMNAAIAWMTI